MKTETYKSANQDMSLIKLLAPSKSTAFIIRHYIIILYYICQSLINL